MLSALKGYESNERETDRIVRCVAWSADEKYVATGDGSEKVIIWDTDPGNVTYGQEFQTSVVVDVLRDSGHTTVVRSVDWAPRGHDLVSGDSYGRILAWHVDLDTSIDTPPFKHLWGASSLVNDLLWFRDDRVAAITSDGFLYLWDPTDRSRTIQPIFERRLASSGHCIAASADLSRIAIGKADGTLEVVDAADGSRLDQFRCHDDVVCAVAWCSDHEVLLASGGDSLLLLDIRSGETAVLDGHRAPILSIATTPDGRVAITQSLDMSLRLWDLALKAPLEMFPFQCGRHANQRIGFSENGSDFIALGRRDHVFRTWRMDIDRMREGLKGAGASTLSRYTRMDRVAVIAGQGLAADEVISSVDDACERIGLKCVGLMPESLAKTAEVLVDARSSGTELFTSDLICRSFLENRAGGVVYHYIVDKNHAGASSCQSCGGTVRIVPNMTDLRFTLSRTLEDRRRAQRQLALVDSESGGPDVFVCYNHLDTYDARRVAEVLRRRGIDVWHDESNLPLGSPLASAIASAIDRCKVSLVLLGTHGIGAFQELEIEALVEKTYRERRASKSGTFICPVMLSPAATVPFKLGVVGRTTFTLGTDDSRVELLANEVAALLE